MNGEALSVSSTQRLPDARKVPSLDDVRVMFDVGGIAACDCDHDIAVIRIIDSQRELPCERCCVRRGLLGDRSASFIAAICAQFGAPTSPIILRRPPQ
jgi:hypothetical protein